MMPTQMRNGSVVEPTNCAAVAAAAEEKLLT
jgi:hypothetical protein